MPMAESYSFHTKTVSHISGSFLFQEKYLKQNFKLSQSHIAVNPVNYTKHYCRLKKKVFKDFADSKACKPEYD